MGLGLSRLRAALLAFLVLQAAATPAADVAPVTSREVDRLPPAGEGSHALALQALYFPEAGWSPARLAAPLQEALRILGQCGIRAEAVTFHEIAGGDPAWRDLGLPGSVRLAGELAQHRPALFFVRDTRRRIAFEAEAFGRGNTRRLPALAGTVWVTRGARDLPLVIAHELAHVLMDSGEHVDEPGNLMRDETAPGNTALTPAQCARMREAGKANGWLQ